MDGGLNKFATALIAVLLLIFLLILAQILYFLSRRHHQLRNQSRVEPKEIVPISKINGDSEGMVVVVETTEDELEKWQELCGPSRTLFTIKEEEEEREGIIECFEYDSIPKLKTGEDTTPFHTPSASPPYFTPSSSPTRDAYDIPAVRLFSDDNRTLPFEAIEITTRDLD